MLREGIGLRHQHFCKSKLSSDVGAWSHDTERHRYGLSSGSSDSFFQCGHRGSESQEM